MYRMNNAKNVAILATVLLLSSVTLLILPVQAQTYTNMQEGGSIPLPPNVTPDSTLETLSHLSFNPDPVGAGQTVTINMWLSPPTHASRYFSNFTLVITAQDGTQQVMTIKSYRSDSTAWATFIPDKAGTWQIKFEFPGGYFPPGNYTVAGGGALGSQVTSFTTSIYYKPSYDGPFNLTVQEEPVPYRPDAPIPTDYWERPVEPENREWWSILGYYPSTGVVGNADQYWPDETNTYMSNYWYIPYVQGPNSAHVVWKRQYAIGGLIGGPLERNTMTSLMGGVPAIIYAGRCYETVTKVFDGVTQSVWQCYDIRTGEIYWEKTGITQIPTLVTFNTGYGDVPGADPQWGRTVFLTYVGGGRLINYDPYTGAVATGRGSTSPYNVSISPLTTGTLYANLDFPYFLSVQRLGSSYRLINWTVKGDYGMTMSTVNVSFRVMTNTSWPFSSLGSLVDYEAGVAVFTQSQYNAAMGASIDANITAVDLYTGQVLWSTIAGVPYNVWPTSVADHGKVAIRFEDGYFYCWDLRTGKKLWTSEMSSWPWGVFGAYDIGSYGGNIIAMQYDGLAAYDWDTGKVSWLYQAQEEYPYDSLYQNSYAFFGREPLAADGKIYVVNTEHTPTQPLTRGWGLHCINATTGEGIWNIPFFIETGPSVNPCAVADGYLVGSNGYDGYTYTFGKGKSQTTVTAPSVEVQVGQKFTITGTVLDMSPAQSGTAAISDEYMGVWMKYLHMQGSKPTDATGVPVTLTAIDPNNNLINIGEAISDTDGVYGFTWTPEVPGLYHIIATFAGSESYGSSTASTYFTAIDQVAPTEPPEYPTPIDNTMTILGVGVAILIAIAIVGLLILRKKQ